MEGVREIQQLGARTLFWKVNIAGKDKEWEAEILEQIPDTRIVWQSVDGTKNRGIVAFETVGLRKNPHYADPGIPAGRYSRKGRRRLGHSFKSSRRRPEKVSRFYRAKRDSDR